MQMPGSDQNIKKFFTAVFKLAKKVRDQKRSHSDFLDMVESKGFNFQAKDVPFAQEESGEDEEDEVQCVHKVCL